MTYLLSWIVNPVYCDGPEPWQIGFQDSASPVHEGITDLHNEIFFYLIVIAVGVAWVLGSIVVNYSQNKSPIVYKYANFGFFRFVINLIFSVTFLGGLSNVTSVYSIRLSTFTFLFLTFRWNKSKAIELFIYLATFARLVSLYYMVCFSLGLFVDDPQSVISVNLYADNFWILNPKEVDGVTVGIIAKGASRLVAQLPYTQPMRIRLGGIVTYLSVEVYERIKNKTVKEITQTVHRSQTYSSNTSTSESRAPRNESSISSDTPFSKGGTSLREDDYPISSIFEGSDSWFTIFFDFFPGLKERLVRRLPNIDAGLDFGFFTELFAKINLTAIITTFQAYLVFAGVIIVCIYMVTTYISKYILARLRNYPTLLAIYGFIIKVRDTVVLIDLLFLLINSYYVLKGCTFISDNYIPQEVGPLYDQYLKNKTNDIP